MLGAIAHFNFRRQRECSTLLDWLQAVRGESVLDVGCGDGYYTERIARSGAEVIGIDINSKALARAQKRRRPGLAFLHMNAEKLDFPEASFDKIISFCVIEHFQEDDRVLGLLARALRPGGRLFFSADSLSVPALTQKERQRHQSRYSVNNFYTREIISAKLLAVGLKPERTRYILSGPFSLALTRLTWKMDSWPRPLKPLRLSGYLITGLAGALLSWLEELGSGEPRHGMTLLVSAFKPQ